VPITTRPLGYSYWISYSDLTYPRAILDIDGDGLLDIAEVEFDLNAGLQIRVSRGLPGP
jgi:hypothetical protein